MFGIWLDLPSWLRFCVSAPIVVAGVWMAVAGARDRPRFTEQKLPNGERVVEHHGERSAGSQPSIWIGTFLTGCGLVLLTTSGRSDSEKRGYKF